VKKGTPLSDEAGPSAKSRVHSAKKRVHSTKKRVHSAKRRVRSAMRQVSSSKKQGRSMTREQLQGLEPLDEMAGIFAALGSGPRLRMLFLLCQKPDLTVGELSKILGISISGTSTHLRRLREAKLIFCRRDGQQVCCTLQGSSTHVRFLRDLFRGVIEQSGCCRF